MEEEEEQDDSIKEIYNSPSAEVIKTQPEESLDDVQKYIPFNTQWIYGLNEDTPIINLNNGVRNKVFFAASQTGVLYDYIEKKMDFLGSHKCIITNIARDGSGELLITADSGAESCVNIWNSDTLHLVKTITSPHGIYELYKLSLSVDGKYLATFGYESKPTLKIWNWLVNECEPIVSVQIEDSKNDVVAIIFDPDCSVEICIALESHILFGYVDEENKKILMKKCAVRARLNDYGKFQCVVYNKIKDQLIACTDKGYLAIFKSSTPSDGDCKYLPKKFVKIVKIEKRGISVVKDCDGYLVVCVDDGRIHIYSSDIKIVFRFDNFDIGRVKALSFNMTQSCADDGKDSLPIRITSSKKKEEYQSFIERDAYINIESEGVGLIDFVKQKYYKILDGFRRINNIAVHPFRPLCCIGDVNGHIQLINYVNKTIQCSGHLPHGTDSRNNQTTCLKFSPSGAFLVCGIDNGEIWFFDTMLLQPVFTEPLKYSTIRAKQIEFSQDSIYMAYSNTAFQIFLSKYDCNGAKWNFVGKYKNHCRPIVNLYFDSTEYLKLITFGEDQIMNVYSIQLLESGEISFLKTITLMTEKYAIPKFVINDIWSGKQGLLITVSDDYKYKVYDYKTDRILATYLSPMSSSPILQLLKLPSNSIDTEYMIFQTEKHVGIQKLPLDGNPQKHIEILGHPIKMENCVLTPDGKYLFTSGEGDYSFYQLNVNTK